MERKQQNEEVEIDLVELFYVLRSRILIILLCTILAGGLTGVVNKLLIEPVYASTTKLFILTKSTSITSLADIQVGSSLTLDYMELVQSRPVVEGVIENLHLDMTYEELLDKMTVENPTNTRILKITVEDTDARMAKEIVDEIAEVSRSRISEIMDMDEPNVVEQGYVEENPVGPKTARNTVVGALVGFLLACGIIIVKHMMDDTIKSSDDIEKYLEMNTLAMIPKTKEEFNGHKKNRFGLGRKKNLRKTGGHTV